jgi:hypothetical protein
LQPSQLLKDVSALKKEGGREKEGRKEGRTYCKVISTTAKARQIECDVSNCNHLRTTIIST